MSRLNDLIRQLRAKDPALAGDIAREVGALADRRAFGLNFERHVPEVVELPGRPVRRGDKVRILPARGATSTKADERLWRVASVARADGVRTATLQSVDGEEAATAAVADLVVVAEFRDPIYPGLVSTGRIERGGDKPFHAVINAENYHALQTLLFSHRSKVDCVYIDPPYNTGARDWKYSNDYVESDDLYRHSKWLAFMERRLLLAKELLNPLDSVLIVSIDEKECLRLGLLLKQVFESAQIQMISSLVNPAAVARTGAFGRSDEYIFFVMLGGSSPRRVRLSREWVSARGRTHTGNIRWDLLRRSGENASRLDRPGCFYPIYVDPSGPKIAKVGNPLPPGVSECVEVPGAVPVLPIRKDGSEGRWQWGPETLLSRTPQGRVRITGTKERGYVVSILKDGEYQKVLDGEFTVVGSNPDGSLITSDSLGDSVMAVPATQWRISSHDATQYGSRLLTETLLPGRKFPFPKSLYAVEDALRFFVGDKPDSLIVDFFAGSGTTAHAVMRLNRQDGGSRMSISITNNEVSADEQGALRKKGFRPGEPGWERFGICEYITKPRLRAAVSGETPEVKPIRGEYKFVDEFPMSIGFEENVEFFTLTYEAPLRVASHREFERIAPLLWLRAGARGRRIDDIATGWDVAEAYGVIADFDRAEDFLKALAGQLDVGVAFVVTDEDWLFESMCRELPERVEPVRLYEAYLRNFELESGRGAR